MDEKDFSWQKFAVDTLKIFELWDEFMNQNPMFAEALAEYYTKYPDYAERYEVLELVSAEGEEGDEPEATEIL